MGLTTVLASPEAHASSPAPLFLAQTLAQLSRKAWAGGGLGGGQLEQAAGLMVRCCQLQGSGVQQQLATQLGLAVCAGVMACPRVAPVAVFGETMALVERTTASVDDAGAMAEARLKLLHLLPEEALRSRYDAMVIAGDLIQSQRRCCSLMRLSYTQHHNDKVAVHPCGAAPRRATCPGRRRRIGGSTTSRAGNNPKTMRRALLFISFNSIPISARRNANTHTRTGPAPPHRPTTSVDRGLRRHARLA